LGQCADRAESKLSRKVLYYFAIFVIVNKLLIIKNRRIKSIF